MNVPPSYRLLCFTVVAWLLSAGPSVSGAELHEDAELARQLQPLIEQHRGEVAVLIKHLETGAGYSYRADEPMPTASLIKLAVMVEAYRQADTGQLDLEQLVTLRAEDKVPGSGVLTDHFSPGAQLPLRDLIRLMIAWSDNTATNLVLDRIGLENVASTMQSLGLPGTRIHAKVFRRDTSIDPDGSRDFGLGRTTAVETVSLLAQLHSEQLISRGASRAMREHLEQCQDRQKLARYLPPGTRFAHKTGSVSDVRCDAGLLSTSSGVVALCVLTRNNDDKSWTESNEAEQLCAAIGRIVYAHFAARDERPTNEPPRLRAGAAGELVEDLQRTLNARLAPSPDLAVDGDFGPQTEAAVRQFQQKHELESTGEVDERTWQALGPLITEDGPVPPPDEVNAQQLSRDPPESLEGPPLVTCRSWAVADADTGQLLADSNAEEALPCASTTKILTAYVVLQLAEKHAGLLDERVVISARAAETEGSTAQLRSGEQLPVRELLYGLLLPSGNDAAVALAEHCGELLQRYNPENAATDPLERFVEEMNRTAKELGLQNSCFRNPHGLPAEGHQASARDLVKLTRAALADPIFEACINTRQRGATLTVPGSYERHVVWKNTNKLLGIEGYSGVKTGTTQAAGACLVACGERAGRRFLVVVLGSQSSDARYVDTRNLFRWAWQTFQN